MIWAAAGRGRAATPGFARTFPSGISALQLLGECQAMEYQLPQSFPDLSNQGMISIDCETHDPDLAAGGSGVWSGRARLAGVSVGTEAGFREYYPVDHAIGPNLPKKTVVSWLREELKSQTAKVGANLLYDAQILSSEGVEIGGPMYDVQHAEPLLDESRFSYRLDDIAKSHLGYGKRTDELDEYLIKNFGKKNHRSHIARAPSALVAPYAISDADLPLKIFAKQKIELEKQGLWRVFKMESDLIPMLLAMRRRGVRVDVEAAEQMLSRMTRQQAKVIAEIKRLTGTEIDPWAAASFQKIFDDEGIPYPLTPKTRKPSFTAAFLEQCEHPVAQMIVEARRLDKMRGTFLKGSILERHHQGRLHCNFNQLKGEGGGAVSGRFSSSAPNLQFIPVRTEEGKLLRSMFLPDEGQTWWKKDYSQIEYRLIVHDAACLNLRSSKKVAARYWSDPSTDFHSVVAEMVFGNADKANRQRAKTINFGLAYGEGKVKLAHQLGMSLDKADELLRNYHRRAPFIKPLSQHFMSEAQETGEVKTLLGRIRRFSAWEKYDRVAKKQIITQHRIPGSRRAFTHAALNARTQGSAADVMKKCMVDSWKSGVYDYIGPPQLTVHDELDGSFSNDRKSRQALAELNRTMEGTIEKLLVPLRVDASEGPDWGSCE